MSTNFFLSNFSANSRYEFCILQSLCIKSYTWGPGVRRHPIWNGLLWPCPHHEQLLPATVVKRIFTTSVPNLLSTLKIFLDVIFRCRHLRHLLHRLCILQTMRLRVHVPFVLSPFAPLLHPVLWSAVPCTIRPDRVIVKNSPIIFLPLVANQAIAPILLNSLNQDLYCSTWDKMSMDY
jgi:hypothetical protein